MSTSGNVNKKVEIMSKKIIYVTLWFIAITALGMGWYTGKVFFGQPVEHPLDRKALEQVGVFLYDEPRPVANFALKNQHDQLFGNSELLGKWTFVFFGYTHCPDVCPGTMLAYQALRAELAEKSIDKAQMLMVTVDPVRDDIATLQSYLAFFHPDYLGLTGEEEVIKSLALSLNAGFSVPEHVAGEPYFVDHSAHISLINPDGKFVGFFQMPHKATVMAKVLISLQ